jgi:hypothetical protein
VAGIGERDVRLADGRVLRLLEVICPDLSGQRIYG